MKRNTSDILVIVLLAMALTTLHCTPGTDWTMFRGNLGSGYTPTHIHPPLGEKWKLSLQEKLSSAKAFNPPMVKGSSIYFGSADGNFYSLDIESGYMNWIFKTGQAVNSIPFVDDDNVYFGSNDGSIYVVNRNTGKEIWHRSTGNTVQSLVVRYKDDVIFTSDTGSTFFMNMQGEVVDRIPNPVWSHHTFQVYDGVVYWAPMGRNFGAYDIGSKRFLWTYVVDVPYSVWYSFPAIDEKRVYFSSSFQTFDMPELHYYALDRKTGELLWQMGALMDLGSNVPLTRDTTFMRNIDLLDYMAPSLWKDLVIYTSGDTIVRAFNVETGEEVWKSRLDYPTSSAPTVAGDRVYFGTRGSSFGQEGAEHKEGDSPQLICLSAADGAFLWSMDTDGAILSAPVIAGNRIFFGTEKHKFYVLEEIF